MFTECTEARYDEMLGVVPPIWCNKGFLVGEPSDHRRCKVFGTVSPTFTAFLHINGKFYESTAPMTRREFAVFDTSTL